MSGERMVGLYGDIDVDWGDRIILSRRILPNSSTRFRISSIVCPFVDSLLWLPPSKFCLSSLSFRGRCFSKDDLLKSAIQSTTHTTESSQTPTIKMRY